MNKIDVEIGTGYISEDERKFLELTKHPVSRSILLERLEKLGLLSAFLEAESGTI